MSLEARVTVDHGQFGLDARVEVADGETVAIVGPSGAGKSTLLRAIAGFEAMRSGRVAIDGRVVDEVAEGTTTTHVPAERRSIGFVAQAPQLFPHLSALDNVAFGLRTRGANRRQARREAEQWLDRVGVGHRRHARPDQLSGGEARRVALARALAPAPRVLLLDEPLTGLDAARRADLRALVWSELTAFHGSRLLVTHDPVEAMGVANRMLVIEDGTITHDDNPAAIAEHPASPFAAELVGVNVLRGRASQGSVVVDGGGRVTLADAADGDIDVVLVIHPRAVSLHRTRPEGSARNVWAATVARLELAGERVRIGLAGEVPLVAEVTRAAVSELDLQPGLEVWVSVKATEVTVLAGAQAAGPRGPAS